MTMSQEASSSGTHFLPLCITFIWAIIVFLWHDLCSAAMRKPQWMKQWPRAIWMWSMQSVQQSLRLSLMALLSPKRTLSTWSMNDSQPCSYLSVVLSLSLALHLLWVEIIISVSNYLLLSVTWKTKICRYKPDVQMSMIWIPPIVMLQDSCLFC